MTSSALYDFWKNLRTPKPEWEEFEKMATHCLVETEMLIEAWRQQKSRNNYRNFEKKCHLLT